MQYTVQLPPDAQTTFREKGYLKLPCSLSEEWLQLLRAAIDRVCAHAPEEEVVRNTLPDGSAYISGIDALLLKDEPVFGALLGSPWLLSLAAAICGDNFFPVQEFAVIKQLGDSAMINWHQDVVSHAIGTTCMIGFYLDSADADNGALQIVPGSQHLGTDICSLQQLPSVSMDMEAGDVLVHDLMVAHCSGPLRTQAQRRVVYFEFMNTESALRDEVYPESFLNARTELLDIGKQLYQAMTSEGDPNAVYQVLKGDIQRISNHNRAVKPANYCFDFSAVNASTNR